MTNKEEFTEHFCDFIFIVDGLVYPAQYPLDGFVNGKENPMYYPMKKFNSKNEFDFNLMPDLKYHYKKLKSYMEKLSSDPQLKLVIHKCSQKFWNDNGDRIIESMGSDNDLFEKYVTVVDFEELYARLKGENNEIH